MAKKYRIIINSQSGNSAKDDAIASIQASFKEHGIVPEVIEIEPEADISKVIEKVINKDNADDGVIVAAGGDGTINAVAQFCIPHNLTLGIIPLGTFNYFARNFDIPLTIPEAVKTIIGNHVVKTTVGKVGQYYFLNNSSLGLYKKLIENRESDKSKFGRSRVVALFSAVHTLFTYKNTLQVTIKTSDATIVRKSALVFIANNAFQLKNLGMSQAEWVDGNLLGVSILRELNFMEVVRLLAKGAAKMLDNEANLEQFCTDELVVELKRNRCHVVIDGEIVTCSAPLEIKVCPDALRIIIPISRDDD